MYKLLLFSAGIMGVTGLAAFFGLDQVTDALGSLSIMEVAFLFSLQIVTLLAGAWIWHFLLNRTGAINFGSVFLINQSASLIESLTPSVKFGGEAAKIFLFRKYTGSSYHKLTGIMMVQKFLTMAPFMLLCIVLILPAPNYFQLPVYLYYALALLILFCILLAYFCCLKPGAALKSNCPAGTGAEDIDKKCPGVKDNSYLTRSLDFFRNARTSAAQLLTWKQITSIFTVSLGIWIFYPVKVYFACMFLGFDVHPVLIGLATLFAYMLSMAPLLPGGLGTYEGGMALFFTLGGLTPAEGLAIALVSRLTTFWFPLMLSAGSCILLMRRKNFLFAQTASP
ncbi:lysylphosphatidylglycerol synthase transmembrane domain-containing protein [Desulfonatronovibrio magnus]|uniref:lysylphosphatidylglycerol synthase transmembrane domain-containing protein n=1 Tax=Desulfonatronovibrio magnus TaxID=698827 RepID=UPI0005EACB34|nr:lysylphosphatidylglycerol synthase transmembrane domain-containing protein [Desulfonatronovibrio magnus]